MKPIEKLLNDVEWKETGEASSGSDRHPVATHRGILRIADIELIVYQLSDGSRIFPTEEMDKLFQALAEPPPIQ